MKHLIKSRYLFLLAALLIVSVLHAQHKPFQFGFKGGVNMGWFKPDEGAFTNDGVKAGGSWGFVADFFLIENYSFTTGFDVLYLNGKISRPDTINVGENATSGTLFNNLKTRYLQFPIAFTMRTNDINDKFRIYGQIGYGLGFLLSAKSNLRFTPDDGSEGRDDTEDSYEDLSFTRSSLILGLGVEIPLYKSTFLRSGFKFDNCFVDMYKNDEVKLRNNFFEFSAAIIF